MGAQVFTTGSCATCFFSFLFFLFPFFLPGGEVAVGALLWSHRQLRKGLQQWVSGPSSLVVCARLQRHEQPTKRTNKTTLLFFFSAIFWCRRGRVKRAPCGTAPYLPDAPCGGGDEIGFNSFRPFCGLWAEVGEDHQWAVGYGLGNAGQ